MNINQAAANLAKAVEYEKNDFSDTLPTESFQINKVSAIPQTNGWVEVSFLYRIAADID